MNCSIKKKLFKKLQNHKEFQRIITKVVNNNVQQNSIKRDTIRIQKSFCTSTMAERKIQMVSCEMLSRELGY